MAAPLPEERQSLIDRIKTVDPDAMMAEIQQYCHDNPEARPELEAAVMNFGHSRETCAAFGADYTRLTTLDTLRFKYYKLLLMKEDSERSGDKEEIVSPSQTLSDNS
jgi:hypothetical protein